MTRIRRLAVLCLLVPMVFTLSGCPSETLSIIMQGIAGVPYTPGATVDIQVTIDYTGNEQVNAIGIFQEFPDGWTFNSLPAQSAGNALPPIYSDDDNGNIEFAYITIPQLPATFVYRMNVPANAVTPVKVRGYSDFRFSGDPVLSPVEVLTLDPAS